MRETIFFLCVAKPSISDILILIKSLENGWNSRYLQLSQSFFMIYYLFRVKSEEYHQWPDFRVKSPNVVSLRQVIICHHVNVKSTYYRFRHSLKYSRVVHAFLSQRNRVLEQSSQLHATHIQHDVVCVCVFDFLRSRSCACTMYDVFLDIHLSLYILSLHSPAGIRNVCQSDAVWMSTHRHQLQLRERTKKKHERNK